MRHDFAPREVVRTRTMAMTMTTLTISYRRRLLRLAFSGTEDDASNDPTIWPVMGSKLHRDRLAFCRCGLEELAWLEIEHAGKNVGREGLDLRIQVADHSVVIAARILNRVFGLAQRALQLSKFLRRLQLGIILRNRKQAFQRTGELVLRNCLIFRRSGLHRLRAEL